MDKQELKVNYMGSGVKTLNCLPVLCHGIVKYCKNGTIQMYNT
jgi:hypothetical protein